MRFIRLLVAGALVALLATESPASAVPCPAAPATLTVVADDRSADGSVELHVSGSRVEGAGACDGAGTGLASSYDVTLPCIGSGQVVCGRIPGLLPGRWIHHVSVQVAGSDVQQQTRIGVLLAQDGVGTSNVVDWLVYARTFVVAGTDDTALLATLDAAQGVATSTRPVLVRFDPAIFPGAGTPVTIDVRQTVTQPGNVHVCEPDAVCSDGRHTTYCLESSGVTIDALDDAGERGAVVLRTGTCERSLLRVYGDDVVLRGLVLLGCEQTPPLKSPLDTLVFGGGGHGSRLEQSIVQGPTDGDAVSVQDAAGASTAPIVVVDSEVHGAADKGVKVTTGGVARVERSCVHDNQNGGLQATLGGTITAIENVVQHNVGGAAANGLFSGVPNAGSAPNAVTTRGNVLRFNGARGISVVNNATATVDADVATDNYHAGIRTESVVVGEQPHATVRGATFACNYAPGACPDGSACRVDAECASPPCTFAPSTMLSKGAGAALGQCLTPGCLPPLADFGVAGDDGRNAFVLNQNPAALGPPGANVTIALADAVTIPMAGDQWEHCDVPVANAPDSAHCNVPQIATLDVQPANSDVDFGAPLEPGAAPAPTLDAVSPGRPVAGDLVRVYGGPFDAVHGSACFPAGLPADACSAENPAIVALAANAADGPRVTVRVGSAPPIAAEVHAVSPTMVVFRMPVDCVAPSTVVVARGGVSSAPLALCDPGGCVGRAPGEPCDDLDDVCTLGDVCTADGACAGAPRACDDGDPCTDDGCAPNVGCTHTEKPEGAACAASKCAGTSTCRSGQCVAGRPVSCDDSDACTDDGCDVATGCGHIARTGVDAITCHYTNARALLDGAPRGVVHRAGRRLGCAETSVGKASAASGSATRRRLARRARRCTAGYLRIVARAHGIGDGVRAALSAQGKVASDAITAMFLP